jgi:dihydropteroate synthase
MGIVNVTPDSFSDGGCYFDEKAAIAHGLRLAADGADILDVGGESTRPGSKPVPVEEELRRVIPVIRALAVETNLPVSIDTSKPEVARQSLAAGAAIVNDVTALQSTEMAAVVFESKCGAVLMHMQGSPETMQLNPHYNDVVQDIDRFFEARIADLTAAGLQSDQLVIDPGIGFGKTHEHTIAQLRCLNQLQVHGRPVCLGVSRKGFIGQITGRPRSERMAGSLAVVCDAVCKDSAQIVRVHDVAATRDALLVLQALRS